MTERYDPLAAAHYAAYRPPLHAMILGRVLSLEDSFADGLDVGCGTGYSAIALAGHCARVHGIDPSPSMLGRATPHERVIYQEGCAEHIPLPDSTIGVATFAGSLSYVDRDAAGAEIRRVCQEGVIVIAYDFEILLGEVLRRLGMDARAVESDYDHRANFSGVPGFEELAVRAEQASLEVTTDQLAHILLSDSQRSDRFAARYDAPDAFPALVEELRAVYDRPSIEADLYYSKYRVTKG